MADILQIASISTDEFTQLLRTVIREEVGTLKAEPPKTTYRTRKETAKLLKISLPTLDGYVYDGLIAGSRIGTRVLFSEEAIQQAVKEIPAQRYRRR